MTTSQPARPPRRRTFSFSLRGLLLFFTVMAVVMAFSARPRPRFVRLDDGWRIGLPPNGLTGTYFIQDAHGRTVCTGQLRNGFAVGTWRYYHDNGRLAFAGRASGGRWTAWWESGRLATELEFRTADVTALSRAAPESPSDEPPYAVNNTLSGPVRQWWPNGQLRTTGSFVDGSAEGPWTFRTPDGAVAAELPLGQFEGVCRFAAANDDNAKERLRDVEFVRGQLVEPRDAAALAELQDQLTHPNATYANAAFWKLLLAGRRGTPSLLRGLSRDDVLREATNSDVTRYEENLPLLADAIARELCRRDDPATEAERLGVRWIAAEIELAQLAKIHQVFMALFSGVDKDSLELADSLNVHHRRHVIGRLLTHDDPDVRLASAALLTKDGTPPAAPLYDQLRAAAQRDPRIAFHLRQREAVWSNDPRDAR